LKTKQLQLINLSPHLFWDVDFKNIEFNKNKKLIIQRVLNYGLIGDWQIILKTYGISEIAKTAVSMRELDKKSASFVSLLSKIPKEDFLCYTTKPSIPQYLNF
jgi:hypothetical protein